MVTTLAFGVTESGTLLLASGSTDGTVRLWSPESPPSSSQLPAASQPLAAGRAAVNSVALGTTHRRERIILSADSGGVVSRWRRESRAYAAEVLAEHDSALTAVAFGITRIGPAVTAFASSDGTIVLCRLAAGRPPRLGTAVGNVVARRS